MGKEVKDEPITGEIVVSKAASIEVIYFEKYNGFLRPFSYEKDSKQFKRIIQWLHKNELKWNEADVRIGNQFEVSISIYDTDNLKIYTLWINKEQAVLVDMSNRNLKRIKLLEKNEYESIYPYHSL